MKKIIVIVLLLFPMVSFASSWSCTNDIEVMCGASGCGASDGDDFTPIDVMVRVDGEMRVCAYTGCWEGKGEISKNGAFITFYGQGFRFSTSPDRDDFVEDLMVVVDERDNIGFLKNSIFTQPLICTKYSYTKVEKKATKPCAK